MNPLDIFFSQHTEPLKGCFLALRKIILSQNEEINCVLKYGMPCFCYKDKTFCYLWFHKKHQKPYILFVEGKRFNEPILLQEKRSRMKIMLLEPNEDLPLEMINSLLQKALSFYDTGEIKI